MYKEAFHRIKTFLDEVISFSVYHDGTYDIDGYSNDDYCDEFPFEDRNFKHEIDVLSELVSRNTARRLSEFEVDYDNSSACGCCPNCSLEYNDIPWDDTLYQGFDYCKECGQRIDWEITR